MSEASAGEGTKTAVGEVVYPHASDGEGRGDGRDESGRFLPGNRAAVGGHRRRKGDERAILAQFDRALPPEKMGNLLIEAVEWAREYKSPKLVLSLLQFVVSYRIGTPVQRSISASGKLETLLGQIAEMDDSDFDRLEDALKSE